jgi:hypothetical protein
MDQVECECHRAMTMTPRPIIRWKSFWLGILVVVFLGCAWVCSLRHVDSLAICGVGMTSNPVIVLGNSQGSMFLQVELQGGAPGKVFRRQHSTIEGELELHLPPGLEFIPVSHTGNVVILAHWFLMLLFFFPWAAFLAWRWRRQRNLAESTA